MFGKKQGEGNLKLAILKKYETGGQKVLIKWKKDKIAEIQTSWPSNKVKVIHQSLKNQVSM